MGTTIVAVLGLGVIAFTSVVDITDWKGTLSHYLPRISFVVFVEIFAYFFLRLYRVNLDDVKYYQNELSNLEFKALALRSGFAINDVKAIKELLTELGKTERNFVLKKGETTPELEKVRVEAKGMVDTIGQMTGLARLLNRGSR
jgi:hypothetical protein